MRAAFFEGILVLPLRHDRHDRHDRTVCAGSA
jgi:hypothetical protein